jgi:hypothetical protein
VGKDVVKGNGCYEIVVPGWGRYGQWIVDSGAAARRTVGEGERLGG